MTYSATQSIDIKAPRSLVWKAVTEPEQVKQWFFGTNMITDWNVGSPINFRGEWEGKPYEDKGEVLTYTPEEALSYTYWSNLGGTEDIPENYQTLTYRLSENEGVTILSIEQSNTTSQETIDHSSENWKGVLEALKTYVESTG